VVIFLVFVGIRSVALLGQGLVVLLARLTRDQSAEALRYQAAA